LLIYARALESITQASEKYSLRLPNKWNYSFDYFYVSIMVLLIYVPGMIHILDIDFSSIHLHPLLLLTVNKLTLDTGSPHMYTYMLGQRKKALSKSKTM
jgi:very-long-chain (3R)-3-hydroxyacyl-CoA dehydratase